MMSCEAPVKYDRPRDTWAFRSVLDRKPRMLTLALHKDLYVSYDLQLAKIYKVWKGEVNFDGAVYTTVHGVQPTSVGYTYYLDESGDNQWALKNGGGNEPPAINYLGYSFKKGQITIEYELISKSGQSVKVRETPECIIENEQIIGLSRKFEVSGDTETYLPALSFQIDKEKVSDLQESDATLEKTPEGNLVNSVLNLPEGQSSLNTHYISPPPDWKPEQASLKNRADEGLSFLNKNDCKTCHLEYENMVGPSYDSIAKRYPFKWPQIRNLAQKVINGGSGVWGDVMMTAHKDLSQENAESMIYYILSLDGEPSPPSPTQNSNLFLGVESKKFVLDDKDRTSKDGESKSEGLAANFYPIDHAEIVYEALTDKSLPSFNAIAPAIHITGEDFPFKEQARIFYLEFRGFIKSASSQKKYFRLVSDDGSKLKINGKEIIDNDGSHSPRPRDGVATLKSGLNEFKVQHYNSGGGYCISLQWSDDGENFTVVPESAFSHSSDHFEKVMPFVPKEKLVRSIPGDQNSLNAVHPSFNLFSAKPADFHPRIGGIDFLSEDKMVICTWDSAGSVYILKNYRAQDPETIEVKQIAKGLAEPLGIKFVDGELYVLQKQELTKLIDHNGDEIIDEYRKVANSWHVTSHYHEFAFGLVYKDENFYATLATDLGEAHKNVKDRGRVIRISKDGSETEFIARGFRTPNGIAEGPDGALYVADNQGNWIPTSKIVRVEKGKFYGFKYADYDEVKDWKEDPPLVWMPHGEISNSPSQPAILNLGPYQNQMIHGDVTHGGIKRVYIDEVDGVKQGAVFRFIQGLDAGINRIMWGPDGSLYAGGVGSGGNWRHEGKLWYALHRLDYNQASTFEMLTVKAKSNGMEITLTEPISKTAQLSEADFEAQQYYYEATKEYGGPKRGVEDLQIRSVNVSEDRKTIFLELDEMKEGYVIYIRIKNPFVSENQQSLWSTETWYSLIKKPVDQPGFKRAQEKPANNTLTNAEIEEGWELLFDGKSTANWHNYLEEGVNNKWVVTKNGALHLTERGGGYILSDKEYENFELTLEWKLAPGGNSGLMFNVIEDKKYKTPYVTGPEVQMLDNQRHPDGRYDKHRAGDLYDMIESSFVTANQGGEWNRIRLIIKDGYVQHWQNGYKVVEYQMFNEEWAQLIANSKFKDMVDFGKSKKGRLAIQDHGDKLWLRNIKIREL